MTTTLGTSHVDSSVVLDSKTTIPDHLVGKLVRQTPNRIRFYGVLLDHEKIDALSLDPKNPAWQSAVLSSDNSQRSIFRFLEHNFPEGTFDLKKFAASTALLPLDEQETVQCQRRKSAIQELIPTIKVLKADQLVRSILSTAFPQQSTQILRALLEQLKVDTVGNSGSFDGFTYLLNLFKESNAGSKTNETSFKAFFFPPVSSDYIFRSAANHAGLVVDNQSLITTVPEPKGGVDKPTTGATASAAIAPSFKEGQSYALELTGSSIDELTYATTQAKVRPMTSDIFCPAAVFSNVCFLVSGLQRSAQILDSFKLDLSEITYFAHHGSELASLRLSSLLNLHSYSKCRDKFLAKGRSALLNFLQWLTSMSASSKSHDALVTQLCDQLEAITTFSKTDISAYVNFKCSGMAPLETIKFFENTDTLLNLAECMQYAARTAAPLVSLMEWAKFPSAPTWTEDFEFVSSLTAAAATSPKVHAMSAARDSVRLKRQEILKSFLLTQRPFRDLEITSSDGLFEYFLIDVQMGPDLKSSRIQQAIASVQLFVQRCLLGLEKKNGVPTTLIDQTKWAWKSKFTHWQANRKVFLYPENWVDPTFRDDKTEAFQTFESKVLQSNLSLETINGLIREYIYAANEVADLEVQSYLWEATRGFRGRYHFFARTRTGPSVFYYRKLEVMGANAANAQWNWYPWAKMDVEIPTHEIDADGSTLAKPGTYLLPALFKGRLFLFIPRIMKKTSSPPQANGTFRDLAEKHVATRDPQEYWEIKMAWTELRNGKWSAQQTTSTGIEYKLPTPEKKQTEKIALPSISSFRFSLQTRFAPSSFWASGVNNASSSNTSESGSAGSAPPKILVISVERWHGQNDKEGELFLIGKFEMQGPRLRVVPKDTAVNTMTTKGFRTKFSRLEHDSSSTELKGLIEETAVYKIWDDNDQSRPLLAVVSPDDDTSRESPYNLTWLLAFDDSQYKGASGLILERSTRSKIETFFGFPNVSRDGNIDELNKTTAITQSMTHDVSRLLMENITLSEDLSDIFATLEGVPKYMIYSALGQEGDKFHELASPYAIYNWELGFHIVCLLMERLLAAQQFELALQLSRQVFDPTRDDVLHKDAAPGSVDATQVRVPMSRLDQCWRFHPFKSPEVRTAGSVRDIIQRLEPGSSTSSEIAEWAANPFSAHSVARGRPAVYMKRFVMKCIEILIASGDQYFRNNSLEAMPYAIQRYTEAAELFGPPPQSIDPPTKPVTHTYVQIKNLVNDFASAAIDMELQFPFFTNTADRIAPPNALGEKSSTLGFVRSTYFGVPANPQLKAMRALIDDRFYKIRHGLDIHGNPLSLPLFDPPLDVEQIVAGAASGSFSRTIIAGVEGPMPNYRSLYILEKAMEICNELRSFLDSFLAIKEKRDVESLACLRAKQDSTIQNLVVDMKEMQKAEAVNSLEVLEETRNSHKMRLKYYLDLLGEPSSKVPNAKSEWDDIEQAIERPQDDELKITSQEKWEMDLNLAAGALSTVAASLEAGGGGLMALPELLTMLAPMGMGTQIKFDASNIGKGILVAAGVMKGGAQALNEDASRIAKKGQYISRIQERRLQANMAGHDLKSADKQIVAQRKRIAVAEAEIKLQKQQTQNMTEVEDYLRTKYTSESLYAWLEASVRQSCYQSYLMTMEMAKAAERAFAFEHGPKAQQFLSNAYWNEARDGLLAAQDISMALRRMEAAYMKAKAHDYEITKNISLRQIAPLALFSLRDKGTASFVLPEVVFDYDFPGHYCRRIKSVAISIPCIIGPYTSASCTLRLLEHRYRLKAGASSTGGYYEEDVDGDERFRTDNVPVTAVAISSAHQDTGVFDLNFKDERYIPFEGAGTISRWQLDLPAPFRQFDYNTISDVVISLKYTALEGGAVWRKTATEAVIEHRKRLQERQEDGGAFLTLKVPNDFPEEWSRFLDTSSRTAGISAASLKLKQLSDRLPFWTTGQRVCTGKLWLILTPEKDESKELQNTIKHDSVTLLGAKMVPSSENYEKFILLESNDEKDLREPLQDGELVFSAEIVRRKIQNCWVVVQYSLS